MIIPVTQRTVTTMKIYVAGPDVFRPDAVEWAEKARRLVEISGHVALMPTDNQETAAAGIFRANMQLIRECDAVVANLNPFRGCEPDSGTCFEIGCAVALGKRVVGYLDDDRAMAERLMGNFGAKAVAGGSRVVDGDGYAVENFGLPLNLMLSIPCEIVRGDLSKALETLGRYPGETAEQLLHRHG